jgi:hypothetical protein
MSDDIVERLRACAEDFPTDKQVEVMKKAATEIEQLREEIKIVREVAAAEIARLAKKPE